MGKIIMFLLLFTLATVANEESSEETNLKTNCLECHALQQIPNTLIYRRYLMTYSTKKRIAEAMFSYLKNPKKSASIMPPQFFLKFPMRGKTNLEENILRENIVKFIDKYDVKKELFLEKNNKKP